MKTLRKVLLMSFVVFAFSASTKGQILDVEEVTQEQTNWCWAAVSSCMLDYYNYNVEQCVIAEYTRTVSTFIDFGDIDCCDDPTQGCDQSNIMFDGSGSIQDILNNFGNLSTISSNTFLNQNEVLENIENSKPFIFRWGWSTGGGHFLVGHGIVVNNMHYMDPWFGEGYGIANYDWIVDGDGHNWTHTLVMDIKSVEIAISIDRSGSMAGSYITGAKNAAKSFVDLMQINDFLSVTSFSSSASVNFQFAQITSEQIKTNAKNAINSIGTGGSTSIGAGLQKAQQQLNLGNTDKIQGMILLSDGKENEYPYVSQVLPTIPGNTDIYTIALGPDSDQTLLNNIASATGGFYSYSPNTTRLALIYNSIRAKVTGQQFLAWLIGLIAQGQNIFHDIIVDGGSSLINFSLTWPGSDLDLELTDPNGNIINHSTSNPNVSFTSGPTFETYIISNPVPGQYTAKIIGVSTSGQEPYNLVVTGESSLEMQVAFNKSVYGKNEPILVTAEIMDGDQPVTGASVNAVVTAPSKDGHVPKGASSNEEPSPTQELNYDSENKVYLDEKGKEYYFDSNLSLYDDGLHGDGSANDGIYGNYYTNTSALGSYSFDISATGTAPLSGSFTRIQSKSTTVTFTQSIVVTEPQTGSTWYANSYHNVQWSSTNITGNVDIYLSINGGSTYNIPLALNITDDGSELCLIPNNLSATCRIKVQSIDYSAIAGTNPGNFSINKPVLTVVPANISVAPEAGSATFDIHFSNQAQIAWTINNMNDWITISQNTGNGETTLSLNYTLNILPDPRSGIVTINAPNSQNGAVNITVTQEGNPNQCAQTIDIPLNWSAVSSYLNHDDPQLEVVFAEIQANVVIMLGKNGLYWPGQNINTIGDWNPFEGYKIKMNEASTLCMNGEMVTVKTVNLPLGTYYLPVLDDQNIDANEIFSQIDGKLIYAFDMGGAIYWPDGGLYTLQTLEPGKGYLVSMSAPGSVTFPESKGKMVPNNNIIQVIENSPWTVTKTGSQHIITIYQPCFETLQRGDIIAAFNSMGLCVGVTQYRGVKENLPMIIYGDDVTTSATDGMVENEVLTFKVFNSTTKDVYDINPEWDLSMPNTGLFVENGLSAISSLKASTGIIESNLDNLNIFPNPNTGLFSIVGINEALEISVLNTTGQIIENMNVNQSVTIDLSKYSRGIYYLKLVSGSSVRMEKIIIR